MRVSPSPVILSSEINMPDYFDFVQESRERIAELLDIDAKEEDFECREEFPGEVHDMCFVVFY